MKFNITLNISFLIVFLGCNDNHRSSEYDNYACNRIYEVNYLNNSYARLVIFDGNDTIYFSNDPYKEISHYNKIKSKKETLIIIENIIHDEIQYQSLLTDREYTTDSGQLRVKITCGKNEMKSFRNGVDRDLKVSKNFTKFLNLLKKEHLEVYNIFIPN